MGVKYDWLRKRIRGWVHKAIEAGWGGTCEILHCCQSENEKTSMDDLVLLRLVHTHSYKLFPVLSRLSTPNTFSG